MTQKINTEELATDIFSSYLNDSEQLNKQLLSAFNYHLEQDNFRKTHLFNGRYENLYIDRHVIPETEIILQHALQIVSEQFALNPTELKIGFWFNRMAEGEKTTLHRHDDDDEILSGVYYITAPDNSGALEIENNQAMLSIPPIAGRMICFPPSKPHSVSRHNSQQIRLSLAFNIGGSTDD